MIRVFILVLVLGVYGMWFSLWLQPHPQTPMGSIPLPREEPETPPPAQSPTEQASDLVPQPASSTRADLSGLEIAKQIVDFEKHFPRPNLPKVEDVLRNPSIVPDNLLPRRVQLTREVDFNIMIQGAPAGTVSIGAGTEVNVGGLQGDEVNLISDQGARARVPLDATDYVSRLTRALTKHHDQILSRWQNEYARAEARNKEIRDLIDSWEQTIGPKPELDERGRVAIVAEALGKDPDAPNIRRRDVDQWGPPQFRLVDGQPYWTVTISYKDPGPVPLRDYRMALIRHGKIVEWRQVRP